MYPNNENEKVEGYNPMTGENPVSESVSGAVSEPVSSPAPEYMYYSQAPVYHEQSETPVYGARPQAPVFGKPSEAHSNNPPNMYSPGLYASPPSHGSGDDTDTAPKTRRTQGFGFGAFVRAACLVLVCTLFSAAAAYIVTDYRFNRGDFTPTTNQVVLGNRPSDKPQDDAYTTSLADMAEGEVSAQDIYDMAVTQVVGISIVQPESPFFSSTQGPSVVGSGFIVSNDGFILTNYHVIEMAHAMRLPITVVLHDSSTYEAEVVGFEANSDVAVLKIDATNLTPAFIGNSDTLRVGQAVYAVGNPFGDLVYTMTDGIVSALDRVVTVEGKTISTFQFSAAVNSGNSGGPIYNTKGEVIGIVTAKVIRGNVEGIGFAIPINDAINIATELIEKGYISGRPLLGISVQPVSSAHADYFNWGVLGIYVTSVNPGSAAEKAGFMVGDIITALADEEVLTLDDLRFALRQYRAGDTATITVSRGGESVTLTITFDEDLNAGRPAAPTSQTPNPRTPD